MRGNPFKQSSLMYLRFWFIFLLINFTPSSVFPCDDTLVMLLTAANPTSEFTLVIRAFTNDLTTLGLALKADKQESYDVEMNKVMNSWLEISKRYMNNPPEEAKNDLNWANKTSQTAKTIGEIRRFVIGKKHMEAHNLILELSSSIGGFFEAFGISDEKQLFINTSTHITLLEKELLKNDSKKALEFIQLLKTDIASFTPLTPEIASLSLNEVNQNVSELEKGIGSNLAYTSLDASLQKTKTLFNELRSQILMKEWFPGVKND